MGLLSSIIGSGQTSRAVGAQVDWDKQAADKVATSTFDAQTGLDQAKGQANAGLFNGYNQQTDNLNDKYGAETGNLDPYLQAGRQGITSLSSMLQPGGELTKQFSFDPKDLQNDPGYQFQLQQGQKAINNSTAANGLAGSGSQAKALSQYNQGLAGTTYNNAYNRALTTFQTNRANTLAPLNTLIGAGQTATGQFDQAAQSQTGQFNQANQNYGNTVSSNDLNSALQSGAWGVDSGKSIASIFDNIGKVKASGSIAQGNIWGGLADSAAAGLATGGLSGLSTALFGGNFSSLGKSLGFGGAGK